MTQACQCLKSRIHQHGIFLQTLSEICRELRSRPAMYSTIDCSLSQRILKSR